MMGRGSRLVLWQPPQTQTPVVLFAKFFSALAASSHKPVVPLVILQCHMPPICN